MPTRLKAARLRKQVAHIISHQPIYLTRWVRVSGNDIALGDEPSYGWQSSWRTRRDPMGRNVWGTMPTTVGTAAEQTTTITLPYVAGQSPPEPDDLVILLDVNGNNLGKFLVVHNLPWMDNLGDVWKYDLTVQDAQ